MSAFGGKADIRSVLDPDIIAGRAAAIYEVNGGGAFHGWSSAQRGADSQVRSMFVRTNFILINKLGPEIQRFVEHCLGFDQLVSVLEKDVKFWRSVNIVG